MSFVNIIISYYKIVAQQLAHKYQPVAQLEPFQTNSAIVIAVLDTYLFLNTAVNLSNQMPQFGYTNSI